MKMLSGLMILKHQNALETKTYMLKGFVHKHPENKNAHNGDKFSFEASIILSLHFLSFSFIKKD